MKITFLKEAFLDKMSPMMGTVSLKNSMTVLEGILIETMDDNSLRLTTYDMNKGIRLMMTEDVTVEEPGSCIIPAARFIQYLKVMPEKSMITIDIDKDHNTLMYSGSSSFTLTSVDGKEYPLLPELSADRGFTVSGGVMKKMINKVLHSVAVTDTRPMLCGAFFRLTNGKMEVVSCDSYTLSRCVAKCDLADNGKIATEKHEFIIPGHALNELIRLLPDGDETVAVELTRKHAIYRLPDMIFFTRTIDSEYIDYNRIMPKDQTIWLSCNRLQLLGGLERAGLIAEEKIVGSVKAHVKLTVEGNILRLSSATVRGKVVDEVPIIHEGPDLEIAFNCRYLINSVRAAEDERIKITMRSEKSSITIEPILLDENDEEDERFFYMILPVKIYGT